MANINTKKAEKEIRAFADNLHKYGTKIKYNKKRNLYVVYSKKTNEVVGWRGTKEDAIAFANKCKNLKIEKCQRRCPTHVRLILDEFANIGQIPAFDQKLATIRKYEISCAIIVQALSQLKEIYDKKWNTIVGNCDTKLFLGSDDEETIEWLCKMMGKATKRGISDSYNSNGGGSESISASGEDLLTPDRVALMADDECIVRIRGVRPHWGKKYDLEKHPNYKHAIDTKGTFEIPTKIDVSKIKHGPLYEQERARKAMKLLSAAGTAKTAKNTVRKKDAEAAKDFLSGPSPVDPPTSKEADEKEAEEMLKGFGITPGASHEEIKDALGTLLERSFSPYTDSYVYEMTN